jgi:hypothetical protein
MYTIYHVLGIKVGCTTNLEKRTSQNKEKYGDSIKIEILETLEDSLGDHEYSRKSFSRKS